MQLLRQNTSVKVVLGPVVAVGDGYVPVTNLTLTGADEAEIIKHDAAAVTSISSNTIAAITSADGYYNVTLTASDTDTLGMLTLLVNDDSLILPVVRHFMVVTEAEWDTRFLASVEEAGTAQAGAAGTITLRSTGPSTADDFYNNKIVRIVNGTGAGQSRVIHDYVGSTKVASISPNWVTNPTSSSDYVIEDMPPAPTATGALAAVNIQEINGTTVTGDGTLGTEWGPA